MRHSRQCRHASQRPVSTVATSRESLFMVGSVETLRHVREKRAKPLVSTISRLRDLPDSVRLNLRSCYTLGASKSSRRHGVFKAPRPVGTAFWFDEGPRYGSTFVSNTPWHCWKPAARRLTVTGFLPGTQGVMAIGGRGSRIWQERIGLHRTKMG